jgi:tetratricopeptide (TPR) repeat protein
MAADKKAYIRNAQKQVQKGQLDRAIASYKAILKMDRNDEKVHNALGDLYIRRNMKNEGIQEYLWVADYYEKDGFHLRSIAICQKILNLDANLAGVRRKLADLYSQQRLPAEAKKQYLQVADYFDRKGKVAEALEVFGKIADLDPDNLKVRVRLGAMFEKQSLPSKAAGEYTRAAEGHLKKNELDKAAELLGKALVLNPENSAARRAMAELHTGREEWDEVVQALEPLMADDAADAQVLKTYAAACLKIAKPAEAVKALEMAREKEPSSLPVKTLLGRAYLQGEELEKALEIYSPMISDYLKDNKVEAAEDLSRQLADAGPENDKALQRHLEVLQRKGDTDEIPDIYLKLADIYQARELPRNAVGVLEKYLELKPGDQEVTARVEAMRTGAAPAPAVPPSEAPAAEASPSETPAAPPAPSLEEEMEVEMIDRGPARSVP